MALKYLLAGQMRYMKENGFEVIMVSSDGKEREEVIANEGCEHHIISMTRKITPFADLRSLWKLYRYFKKQKPDIVHSHTPKAGMLAMLAAKWAGIKIRIHTVAGLRFMTASGTSRKIMIKAEKLTAKWATQIWPNSNSLLNYIKEHKLAKPGKLQVIGHGSSNGINLKRYSVSALRPDRIEEIKRQLNYDEELSYLLSVGRIVKDKGIDELLSAFKNIYDGNNNTRLVLLGTFEDELDPVSDEARKILREHPGIIHINWSDDVEYFMHLTTILVHPSYREGFPNVLLQAGAMSCPIVCSRIEGNVDVVEDGITGMICEVKDKASLEDKLRLALANPEQLRKMALSLRQKIEQYFDQRILHETIKNKYLELLNEQ